MEYVRIVRRGANNSRVLLADGTTRLVPNSELGVTVSRSTNFRYGVEIEFIGNSAKERAFSEAMRDLVGAENYSNPIAYGRSSPSKWVLGRDGSVHSSSNNGCRNPYGYELTSPILRTEEDFEMLGKVYRLIKTIFEGYVNKTCGGHLHISGFGRNIEDARKVQKFYGVYESYFDALVSSSRRENRNHYTSSVKEQGNIADGVKYIKLSIRKFSTNGSIENRHHQGTLSITKMKSWATLNSHFIKYVLNHNEEQLMQNIPASFNMSSFLELLKMPAEEKAFFLERSVELE